MASGRLDVGLGAGWHAPEFTENGIRFPSTHERLAAVERTVHAVRSTLRATTPPIWLGGKRSGILAVAGRVADGWNLAWDPTPATYLQRSELLERAAIEVGRDGSQISRSIGLTTLLGTDEEDLLLRWIKLRRWAPGAHLDKVRFDTWRQRGLIGAPDEIRHRISMWHDLGVTHIVCAFGIPFGMCDDEQLELFAATVLHDSDPPTM
ncbi:MAG: LLM class flavin-dependent oxidoreductase [Pseudonocardiaceae bacterium]